MLRKIMYLSCCSPLVRQGVLRGARVLRLTERDDGVVGVETWIRLEDGSREDQAPAAHSLRGFQLMCDAGLLSPPTPYPQPILPLSPSLP